VTFDPDSADLMVPAMDGITPRTVAVEIDPQIAEVLTTRGGTAESG